MNFAKNVLPNQESQKFNMEVKKEISISVIIPVYNAEKFLENAVESAIHLEHVGEIVLVEDGSPDKALEVCLELEKRYMNVTLYRHPGGENRGAAASRNLGIQNSQCQYVAFLDADDWYLPHRFQKEQDIFSANPDADIVFSYPVLEKDYKDEMEKFPKEDPREGFGQHRDPEKFYKNFIDKAFPFFHTNTVTIKKSFLLKQKAFDERLRLHQDSELWLRLLRTGNTFAGELTEPVAVIRRHDKNRITSRDLNSRLEMLAVFVENVGVQNLFEFEKKNLVKNILRTQSKMTSSNWERRAFYFSKIVPAMLFKDRFLGKLTETFWPKS